MSLISKWCIICMRMYVYEWSLCLEESACVLFHTWQFMPSKMNHSYTLQTHLNNKFQIEEFHTRWWINPNSVIHTLKITLNCSLNKLLLKIKVVGFWIENNFHVQIFSSFHTKSGEKFKFKLDYGKYAQSSRIKI